MKKAVVFHPFLFAVFSILFLFSHNISQVSTNDIILPVLITIFFTGLLWLFLNFILKNNKKAGLVVSLFLLLFFLYGHFFDLIMDLTIGGFIIGRHRYFLSIWGIFFILGSYFIIKTRRNLHNLTSILNILVGSFVAISIINIIAYELKAGFASHDKRSVEKPKAPSTILRKTETLPDIYYIILDGYASSSTLKKIFAYTNHGFIDYLTDKGFYIASESRCNYDDSVLSIASSLNMAFLSDTALRTYKFTANMIKNNKVMQDLKSIGYRYILFSSGWAPTSDSKHADIVYRGGFLESEFNTLLIQTTILRPFLLFSGKQKRDRLLFTFEKLEDMPDIEEPIFVFAHLMFPHPPYVFNREGKIITRDLSMTEWEPREKYLDQVIFLNKKLKMLVDTILSKSENPPIIILQADHGPKFSDISFENRTGIFNAYYLPGKENTFLYKSITPVNSFRAIFNLYFNAHLELLPDDTVWYMQTKQNLISL